MLAHSFDRFYMVTTFILPSIQDLSFFRMNYGHSCAYLDEKIIMKEKQRKYFRSPDILQKIDPYVNFYKKQIKSYNNTLIKILER